MGTLTLLALVVGGFLSGLVIVAALVAAWEWLRQREMLESLRRDRAISAATSPLPLSAEGRTRNEVTAPPAPGETPVGTLAGLGAGTPARRGPNWIETRPMVLSFAPAVDDETVARSKEPDLRLD